MQYAEDCRDISPIFDDCPSWCNAFDEPRDTFCDNCDLHIAGKMFETETLEALAKLDASAKLSGNPDRYSFEYLKNCVIDCLEMEDLPCERRTVHTARMMRIIKLERNRISRLKAWEDRQAAALADHK
jgi:hypothetical protein